MLQSAKFYLIFFNQHRKKIIVIQTFSKISFSVTFAWVLIRYYFMSAAPLWWGKNTKVISFFNIHLAAVSRPCLPIGKLWKDKLILSFDQSKNRFILILRICHFIASPSVTICHPLVGVINKSLEKQTGEPLFPCFFKGLKDMSQKKNIRTHIRNNFHKFG